MEEYRTRCCPRCGEELFEDMQTCFGCLYGFPDGPADEAGQPPDYFDLPSLEEVGPYQWDQGLDAADPRWEDETLDLSALGEGSAEEGGPVAWFRTPSMDVRLEVPTRGISVGRGWGNDVVLHSAAVSREHARLTPAGSGVTVMDLGATNPATFRGREVGEGTTIPLGGTVDICGTFVTIVGGRGQVAAAAEAGS